MEETVVSYQSSVRQPKRSPSLLESSVMTFSKVISLDRPKQFQRYNDGCLFRNTKLSIDSRSLPIKTIVITKKYYNSMHSITRGTIRLSFFLFLFFFSYTRPLSKNLQLHARLRVRSRLPVRYFPLYLASSLHCTVNTAWT